MELSLLFSDSLAIPGAFVTFLQPADTQITSVQYGNWV